MDARWSGVGGDVRAALDGQTGQPFERRLAPDRTETYEWITSLPVPIQRGHRSTLAPGAGDRDRGMDVRVQDE